MTLKTMKRPVNLALAFALCLLGGGTLLGCGLVLGLNDFTEGTSGAGGSTSSSSDSSSSVSSGGTGGACAGGAMACTDKSVCGASTECATHDCVAGCCTVQEPPDGTTLTMGQIAGDC